MNYLQPADRQQLTLMNSLDDLVSENNIVRIIDLIIDQIVKSNPNKFIKQRHTEVGRPSYSPSILLKLYLYGYLNGISSSRKLEAETYRNIEVIWLLGELRPDHWTISNYRKEHGEQIKFITREFRRFLKANGYIKGKTLSIDGTKVKANAKRDMLTIAKIEKRLKSLNEKIEEYLQRMTENDIVEDIEEEAGQLGGSEINRALIEKLIAAEKKIEKLQRDKEFLEKSERKRVSPNDKEARLMRTRDGKLPAYNVQMAVDQENKLIADSEVVTEENDQCQLESMVESIEEEIGEKPKEIITDKGYYNPSLIKKVESTDETECYVAIPEKSRKEEDIKFTYDSEKDEYKCSEGKRLVLISKGKKRRKRVADVYRGIECAGCIMRDKCTKSKKGRIIHRYYDHQWMENYRKKMEGEVAREKIKKRKSIAEHPFGVIKYWMGKIPLLLRGKEKVTTEINIYTTVYNLRRLINIVRFDELVDEIKGYNWAIA